MTVSKIFESAASGIYPKSFFKDKGYASEFRESWRCPMIDELYSKSLEVQLEVDRT